MKGDTGSGPSGDDQEWRNPYPLPGQDWGTAESDVPPEQSEAFQPLEIPGLGDAPPLPPASPGVPMAKAGPMAGDAAPVFPAAGRPPRSKGRRLWPIYLGAFVLAPLIVFSWAAFQVYGVSSDAHDKVGGPGTASSPPSSPEPEPVSTVPPKVKGWTAVTSAKYGLTYDVPSAWRVLPAGTLRGYEGIDGGEPVAMSSAAVFREDACRDGDDEYDRGGTGFNQYVEGTVTEVAKHAANKWAAHAYQLDGVPAPAVTVGAPEPVRVGRAKAVHVRADVVLKTRRKCLSPTAVVHVVAVPGVAAGKTTVFVLLSDQGVPDALPKAEITKVLRSLRPS